MNDTQKTAISKLKAEIVAIEARLKHLRDFVDKCGIDPELAETVSRAFVNEAVPVSPPNGSPQGVALKTQVDRIAAFFVSRKNHWATAKEVAAGLGDITASSARDCMTRSNRRESFDSKEKESSQEKEFQLTEAALKAAQKGVPTNTEGK